MRAVWPDSFVEESNITRTIHTLRNALGEDDNGNKYIETVAKKGHRFVAEVSETCELEESKEKNGVSSVAGENLFAQRLVEPENAEAFQKSSQTNS